LTAPGRLARGKSRGGALRDGIFPVVAILIAALLPGLGPGVGWSAEHDAEKPDAGAAQPDAGPAKRPGGELPLDGRDGRELALDQFRPRSMLQAPQRLVDHAKLPVVDVHTHPRIRLHDAPQEIDQFVALMDQQNIAVCVSLDGRMGAQLEEHKAHLWTKYESRFVIFANIDWRGDGREEDPASWDCQRPDFAHRTTLALAEAKKAGASGLKVFKGLGLEYRNSDNSLLRADDARWDPIWDACGKLGLPVLIHTGDPAAFFLPVDATNERGEELRRHPDWSFHRPGYPTHAELLEQFEHIVARHPGTTFIGAHVAGSAEDLARLGGWLDQYPNLYFDIAARIAELGRQPRTARKFLIRYADRALFGTDGPREPERLRHHWRFLETDDEYFPYAENPFPPQGFWRIYGIELPDDVLAKIYFGNAVRLIPGVKERYEAFLAARNK
jgi:predicted TIM-barrel fold metal-dependent hydrolase